MLQRQETETVMRQGREKYGANVSWQQLLCHAGEGITSTASHHLLEIWLQLAQTQFCRHCEARPEPAYGFGLVLLILSMPLPSYRVHTCCLSLGHINLGAKPHPVSVICFLKPDFKHCLDFSHFPESLGIARRGLIRECSASHHLPGSSFFSPLWCNWKKTTFFFSILHVLCTVRLP